MRVRAEHKSRMIRRAQDMDGTGPSLHRTGLTFDSSTSRVRPSRKKFCEHGMFFGGYEGLRDYLQRYGVPDDALLGYVIQMRMGENPKGFEVHTLSGPRFVFIYMNSGRYGLADDPNPEKSMKTLTDIMAYMRED